MKVTLSAKARKALLRSNKRGLILEKLHLLAADPLSQANNVARLKGRDEYRLRVRDWRVIFLQIEGEIVVREIGPRGSVYEE